MALSVDPTSKNLSGFDADSKQTLLEAFRQLNLNRLFRVRDALGERQQVFLDVLPLTFHVNHPSVPGYVSGRCPVGISNYVPSKQTLSAVGSSIKSKLLTTQATERPPFWGIYLMGSPGTIAHSGRSDLDIWLCHDPGLSAEQLQAIKVKVDALEEWGNKLGLEVHLFLMNDAAFREQVREAADGEDCGSAQHYLLLDEFYRTATLIAGRYLLWWLVPSEHEARYQEFVTEATERGFIRADEYLDFGGIPHIPAEEFIGAGLWQIAKSIESPYKSLLKLLLTELYASQYPDTVPLCLAFKEKVHKGEIFLDELDPYIIMYRQLEAFLQAQGADERLELVRRCFYVKTKLPLSGGKKLKQLSWRRESLKMLVRSWGWHEAQYLPLDDRAHWGVKELKDEHRLITAELMNCYRVLSGFNQQQNISAAISDQDLTFIGRKLFAAFDKKPGKIELFNPNIASNSAEPKLTIVQAPGSGEEEPSWLLYLQVIDNVQMLRQYRPIQRSEQLIELLAWAYFNNLIGQTTDVLLMTQDSNLSKAELERLVKLFLARFETDSLAALEKNFQDPAKPVHGLMILNAGYASANWRETLHGNQSVDVQADKTIVQRPVGSVDHLVVNSWGEVINYHFSGANALLDASVNHFNLFPGGKGFDLCKLSIHCYNSSQASSVKNFAQQYYAELYTQLVAQGSFAPTRLITQSAGVFVLLQAKKGHLDVHPALHAKDLALLLSQPQNQYSRIVFSPKFLPQSVLKMVCDRAESNQAQIFYQLRQNIISVYLIDELGSLLHFQVGGLKVNEFVMLTNRLMRRCEKQINNLLYEEEEQPLPKTIPFFEVHSKKEGGYQLRRRQPELVSGNFVQMHLLVDLNDQHQLERKVEFSEASYAEAELGEQFMELVAAALKQQLGVDQPIKYYVTEVSFSEGFQQARPRFVRQTVQYFRYKNHFERELNRFLKATSDSV